jgi:hypothetical protein
MPGPGDCEDPRSQYDEPEQRPELTDAQIEQGWRDTFSTNNPFCPCNLKTFTKAARWAEANVQRPAVDEALLGHLKFAVKLLEAIPFVGRTAQIDAMRSAIEKAEGRA